ncbi:MAG TPA: YihY/virulence factor BrkB family protein, partial [Clostridia bacterium]|nr:YihY/virulence factor BrkB family protein [Clostridia bacterium]
MNQGIIYSSYLAFYLLLSIFPFIMAVVAIMGFIPFELEGFFDRFIGIFPQEVHLNLKNFVESNRRNSNLIGYSMFFLLWSSARAIGAIRKSLDMISGEKSRHNFIKQRFFDSVRNFAFIFLLLIIFLIPTIIKLTKLGTLLLKINIPYFLTLIDTFQWVFILAMLFGIISLIYMRMGTKKYNFREVWRGALLAAIGWSIMSYLFNGILS